MRSHRSALAAPTTDRATGTLLAQLELEDAELSARLAVGLGAAEKELQDTTAAAADPRVAELTGHLAAFGGKRLRPLLVLLGAEFGEPWRAGVTEAAVIAELVHVSSLYHDDVMDAATTRHGVPSANARWGSGPPSSVGTGCSPVPRSSRRRWGPKRFGSTRRWPGGW